MTGRALLFDVGNTRVKWAIADGDALVRSGAMRLDRVMDRGFDTLATRLPLNHP